MTIVETGREVALSKFGQGMVQSHEIGFDQLVGEIYEPVERTIRGAS